MAREKVEIPHLAAAVVIWDLVHIPVVAGGKRCSCLRITVIHNKWRDGSLVSMGQPQKCSLLTASPLRPANLRDMAMLLDGSAICKLLQAERSASGGS